MTVIIDEEEYDKAVMNNINNDNFHELRKDPLPESIKLVEKTIKALEGVIRNLSNVCLIQPFKGSGVCLISINMKIKGSRG